MSADDLVQLRHLGSRLGFELIDELAAMHARLDAFKDRPEARGASALMPLMDSLVQAGMKDRNDIYGWSLRGRIDGVLVNFRPGGAASYGGGAGHRETHFEAVFEPLLELGLKMTHQGVVSRMARKLTGRLGLQTGREDFDRAIHVQAGNPQLAAAQLADPAVQQALIVAFATYPYPVVTDRMARIDHYGLELEETVVRRELDRVASVVRVLGGVR
ncbi:MAG TPA: hypothetical protein VN598_10720 [Usitatibacter sp.]|nr:hypothetical protein [Usitatibacter sp.]